MRLKTTLVITLTLFALLMPFQAAKAEEVARIPLDSLDNLGLRLLIDRAQKTEGRAALKIETQWPTLVCLGQVTDLDIENSQLLFKARVRTQLQGAAYLEMWCHFGDKAYFSKGLNNPAKGNSDWQQLQTPFILQKGQRPDKITLNLVINGHGTVWVDEVIVVKTALQQ